MRTCMDRTVSSRDMKLSGNWGDVKLTFSKIVISSWTNRWCGWRHLHIWCWWTNL